jgi:hypothetical protein
MSITAPLGPVTIVVLAICSVGCSDSNQSESKTASDSPSGSPQSEVRAQNPVPPVVAKWQRIIVKGYSIPVPSDWIAASEEELQQYNAFLVRAGQNVVMDGRLVQSSDAMLALLGVNICVVPRAISEEELASMDMVENQDRVVREVDEAMPGLYLMRNEGVFFDEKSQMLLSQTSSVGVDGTRMAYNGIILFRDGIQVELHGNSLLNDKENMAAMLSLIASGVARSK